MTVASIQKRRSYLVIGGVGIFLAAGYLSLSLQLPMGHLNSPGAAIFPLIAGSLLLIGSISAVWEGWRMEPTETAELPIGDDLWRLLALIAALIGYLIALSWLGQLIASILFCIVLMKMLSKLSLVGIVIRSVIMMVPVYYIFVHLLGLPMPRGIFL
ncbi:hypothetical protein GCM10007276_14500 [Agaricicola taiwanensis]|uniref:DUF1468 domain-containing protein n=1 Tax=Agaricicola taiwanensis TaxID=591372 RepID=A0A8J2YEP4_9RHOB|nr:tripartite tricarboxylate transporter TctB family protein [Agaricicola taiwanensis]GGE38200.1 hypothetical protein GCM10007276_14500 [Agaricicola taiwanensis]